MNIDATAAAEPIDFELQLPCHNLLQVPRLADYFGVWAMHEVSFRAAVCQAQGLDLKLHIEQFAQGNGPLEARADARGRDYPVTSDGTAVIGLYGPLMKFVSSLAEGTSTVGVRRQIRAAVRDKEVGAILLSIDSPGGTVSGTADLADEVKRAASKKPLIAYIEDLGASAAYWVASQAQKIFANRTAAVGSIGTYGVIWDQSAAATLAGIKVHVIRAGQFKGAGEPGTEITAEQLGEFQRLVDEYNEFFLRGIAAGRPLSLAEVRKLADGRVLIGQAAVEQKLIDGIQTFDETLRQISSPSRSIKAMSEPNTESLAEGVDLRVSNPAAPFEDLKICCPGADNDFLCGQLARKATVDQAQTAWMEEQNRRLQKAQAETQEARAKADRPGVEPVKSSKPPAAGDAAGDATARFWEAVREKQAAGMARDRAVGAVVRDDPELHEAMIAEHNERHAPKRRRV